MAIALCLARRVSHVLAITRPTQERLFRQSPQKVAERASGAYTNTMKRRMSRSVKSLASPKKRRVELPEYHTTPSHKTEAGDIIWPAPQNQIQAAKEFIIEWYVARAKSSTT